MFYSDRIQGKPVKKEYNKNIPVILCQYPEIKNSVLLTFAKTV